MSFLRRTCLVLLTASMLSPAGSAAELTEKDLRTYYQAWSDADVDELMSYFSAAAVYEDVATGDRAAGPEEIRKFAASFLEETPGVKVTPTSVLVGAGSAAVEWTMSGGDGDAAWSVRGVCILQHADGRITRATDYWDSE